MPGKCQFNNVWLHLDKYKTWLEKVEDPSKARCGLCSKIIDISNMGEAALTSHAKGAKHKAVVAVREGSSMTITSFFSSPSTSTSVTPTAGSSQGTIQGTISNVTRQDSLRAEVLWALKVANSHYSFKSCEDVTKLFSAMFPDSQLAGKFACGERKCAYLCTFGLAPYFKQLALKTVATQRSYVLLFDESLNHYLQTKQLDVHVRLWDGPEVKTKYIGSEFLGHSTAKDVVEKLNHFLSELGTRNLIQLSMDGPNVNWKVYDTLQQQVQIDAGKSLVNIGSCGLHILHNAFRNGCKATGWDIEHGLSCLYWLFHDSPARHEDFVTATGCSKTMLKFCKHRWVKNVCVAERGLELWPHVKHYVEMVGRGKLPNPKVKSFEEVKNRCADPLFTVKVGIFISIAREIEPFLTTYQRDQPMLPFLAEDMSKLIKGLMGRFVMDTHLKETSTLKLLHVPYQDRRLHRDASQIHLGFAADSTLKQLKCKKVSEKQIQEIRLDTKTLLMTLLDKLLAKAPVNHTLVRCLQCLDPRRMAKSKDQCVRQLKLVLHSIVEAKHLNNAVCDDVLREFREFCDWAKLQTKFRDFDPKTERVDTLLYETMGTNPSFSRLWDVVKVVLVLSHGQASVERGFSINKELIVENQKELSLVA
ncbi:hypothetical protein N1851_018653 [Merluccius polli]|uniref:HAT C-terminal dimerisation domain-containing protein n=1 Tax=Merluccius polli TaxID=89951 RepID=A0AA47P161_MERPO|nr:hypothetical protein N1851_018653 [Merluccius polli]